MTLPSGRDGARRRPRPRGSGRNERGEAYAGRDSHRRLTLRSATGTAQRTVPASSADPLRGQCPEMRPLSGDCCILTAPSLDNGLHIRRILFIDERLLGQR